MVVGTIPNCHPMFRSTYSNHPHIFRRDWTDRQSMTIDYLTLSFLSLFTPNWIHMTYLVCMYVLVGKETEFCICIVVQHAW